MHVQHCWAASCRCTHATVKHFRLLVVVTQQCTAGRAIEQHAHKRCLVGAPALLFTRFGIALLLWQCWESFQVSAPGIRLHHMRLAGATAVPGHLPCSVACGLLGGCGSYGKGPSLVVCPFLKEQQAHAGLDNGLCQLS